MPRNTQIGDVLHYVERGTVYAACVASVLEDGRVNLGVLDRNGRPMWREGVVLWDGDGDSPTDGPHNQPLGYAKWPPGSFKPQPLGLPAKGR